MNEVGIAALARYSLTLFSLTLLIAIGYTVSLIPRIIHNDDVKVSFERADAAVCPHSQRLFFNEEGIGTSTYPQYFSDFFGPRTDVFYVSSDLLLEGFNNKIELSVKDNDLQDKNRRMTVPEKFIIRPGDSITLKSARGFWECREPAFLHVEKSARDQYERTERKFYNAIMSEKCLDPVWLKGQVMEYLGGVPDALRASFWSSIIQYKPLLRVLSLYIVMIFTLLLYVIVTRLNYTKLSTDKPALLGMMTVMIVVFPVIVPVYYTIRLLLFGVFGIEYYYSIEFLLLSIMIIELIIILPASMYLSITKIASPNVGFIKIWSPRILFGVSTIATLKFVKDLTELFKVIADMLGSFSNVMDMIKRLIDLL